MEGRDPAKENPPGKEKTPVELGAFPDPDLGDSKRGAIMIEIKHEPENLRFVAYDGLVNAGECCYEILEDGVWNAYHTYVKDTYSGHGIAKRLFDALVEEAKKEKVKVMPTCSYVQHCFEKNPELGDMVCPCKEDEE